MHDSRPPRAAHAAPRNPWVAWMALGLMVAGAVPRLAHYAGGRPLWLDESMLASNLLERSVGGLFEPLAYHQVAPPLYLLSMKLAMALLGTTVYAVRLPSILAGLLTLPLFWLVARRLASPLGALLGLAFLAVSQHLIYYAAECKPYGPDALFTVLLLGLALWAEAKAPSAWRTGLLGLAGALAVWYSYPAVFVLAGVGAVQIGCAALDRDWRRVGHWVVAYGVSAVSLLVHYTVVMIAVRAPGVTMSYMSDYWKHGFMPFPPRSWFQLRWFRERTFLFFDMPGGFTLTGLAFFVWLCGAIALWTRHRRHCLAAMAPLAAVLLASGLRCYPFHGRMTLFLAPLIFLLAGQGVALLAGNARAKTLAIALVLMTLLIAQPLVRAARMAVAPSRHHELDRVLEHARQQWQTGDLLYLNHSDGVAYHFMAKRFRFPQASVCIEAPEEEVEPDVDKRIARGWPRFHGHGRLWYAATYDSEPAIDPILEALGRHGSQFDLYRARGAAVAGYALTDPVPHGKSRRTLPQTGAKSR